MAAPPLAVSAAVAAEGPQFSWPWLVPVRPWLANTWVELLRDIGPAFPPASSSDSEWDDFIVNCCTGSAVVFSVGALASLGILIRTCACRRRTALPTSRPSSLPLSFVGLLALVLILFGACAYFEVGWQAAGTAKSQLLSVVQDVSIAAKDTTDLHSAAKTVTHCLDAIPQRCAEPVQAQIDAIKGQVEAYRQVVQDCHQVVFPVRRQLEKLGSWGDRVVGLAVAGPLLPTIVVGICCLAVLFAVWFTHTGRCAWCCMRSFGPLLFAPTVLVVSFAAASQLFLGVMISSFCENVDTNALAYVARTEGINSTAYQLSEYYIAGHGTNPILDNLTLAGQQIQQVQQQFAIFGPLLQQQCPEWTEASNLSAALTLAANGINSTASLLAADRVFRYYEVAVRGDLCQDGINGLGWLVVEQCVAGIICVPVLTAMADRYLVRWSRWRAAQDASRSLLNINLQAIQEAAS